MYQFLFARPDWSFGRRVGRIGCLYVDHSQCVNSREGDWILEVEVLIYLELQGSVESGRGSQQFLKGPHPAHSHE